MEGARQYAALVGDLDDLRAGTDALVEQTNSDFSAGKLTLAEFNDLNGRLGAVDAPQEIFCSLNPLLRRFSTMKQQYLEVGKITNVHGLMGEVRVQPWADSPDFLCRFKTLYVDETHWPIQVERARVHKNMVILKLKDITDVNGALALRNAILYIDRKAADLPEGSFFLADLMGMEVRDAKNGAVLGKIADVLTLPANNVYVVRGGEREWMIPAVPEFVAEVNIDEDYMRVNLMEGL